MGWITSNWPVLVGMAAVAAGAVVGARKFLSLTEEQQMANQCQQVKRNQQFDL